jgi:hypothetical protein
MGYRKRKSSSGFLHKCTDKINRIRKAKKASSKVKAVNSYQSCLNRKGVKTGMKKKRGGKR